MTERRYPKGRSAPVKHALLERLYRTRLSPAETAVVFWLLRWTFGEWNPISEGRPESIRASGNQIASETGVARSAVFEALRSLRARGLVRDFDRGEIGLEERFDPDGRRPARVRRGGPFSPPARTPQSAAADCPPAQPPGANGDRGSPDREEIEDREERQSAAADWPEAPPARSSLALEGTRKSEVDPWSGIDAPLRAAIQRAASTSIESLRGALENFDGAAAWSSMLGRGIRPPGILLGLAALEGKIRRGEEVSRPYGYVAAVASAENARIAAELLETESARRKRLAGRPDPGLLETDPLGELLDEWTRRRRPDDGGRLDPALVAAG